MFLAWRLPWVSQAQETFEAAIFDTFEELKEFHTRHGINTYRYAEFTNRPKQCIIDCLLKRGKANNHFRNKEDLLKIFKGHNPVMTNVRVFRSERDHYGELMTLDEACNLAKGERAFVALEGSDEDWAPYYLRPEETITWCTFEEIQDDQE